jgi:hypothetical protein
MEHHVFERLVPDRDLQRIHHDEVEGDHVARMMHLRKRDFLLDTMLQLPSLHTPFESATNRVSDAILAFLTDGRVVLLLEPIENRVRFQPWLFFEAFSDLSPELLERILACPVRTNRPFDLTRQPIRTTVLPNCLFTHPQPPCNTRH